MHAQPLRLGLVAGEASGDLLGGLLLAGLRQRWPHLQAAGIGGPTMAAQGFDSWWPHDRLSVFGYVDALKRLPELLRIRRQLGDRLLAERPAAVIGIDAPDFNFGLETRLRAGGLRTIHFVCPSIWAWRGERVAKLKAAADHVLCLFPFEPALLQPSSATRWPMRSRSIHPVRRRDRRWAWPTATPWSPCCPAAGAARSATSRRGWPRRRG